MSDAVPIPATEGRLAGIIASAMDAVITVDANERIVLFNPSAERIFGVTAAEALGQRLDRFIPERFRQAHTQHLKRFGETGIASRQMGTVSRLAAMRADGEEFPIEASISHAIVGGEKLFTAVLRDVTERVRAESRIREQADLLNKVNDAILVLDPEGRIQFWNRGAEKLYGWTADEASGRSCSELVSCDDAEAAAALDDSGEWSGELRELTKAGRKIVVESRRTRLKDDDGRVRGTIVIDIDVTEKKELESRFLRAQRLESVGTLVSGIAHDLNNVLTPILMAVKLLKKDKPGLDRVALLETAAVSVERGTAMIHQLLSFAGGAEGERVSTRLGDIVAEIRVILEHSLPKSIRLQTEVADDLWPVLGDRTQIAQVLMNLAVNARDAMPDGGTLAIACENKILGVEVTAIYPWGEPGPYTMLTVTDTGTGIPLDVVDRIFDPFFTTKPFGLGTGLGLSTVLGIVKSHGGIVNVYSELGHGSKFTVYWPVVDDVADVPKTSESETTWNGHGETILVVDDEPPILALAKATLEAAGYRAIAALGGAEGVAIFRDRHREIAAVLLDRMMPGVDGPTAMAAMRAIDPAVKIIAASGLRPSDRSGAAFATGAATFLNKPFSDEELLRTLSGLLR